MNNLEQHDHLSEGSLAGIPARVGVLGGGRMGAGIAHAFLVNGSNVVIVERDETAAQSGRERVKASAVKTIEREGSSRSLEDMVSRLTVTVDYGALADCQLVVEAVPEDWALKVAALQRVEQHISTGTVLATNTSSMSISGLAEELNRPEDFLGLHFFNPVPASALVEIVVGDRTHHELTERARGWVHEIGKTAVVVNDAPGFASSRLGVAVALEAMRMVEEGVASAEDIDNAMVLGYKHHTGPLRTTDIVGLDVRLGVATYLHETLGERFAPPKILRDKVAQGEIGRKSGKGFFEWS